MVNAVALNAVAAGLDNPVAALPQPALDVADTLASLTNGGLSASELNTLSAAVAQVDAGVQSAAVRQQLLRQVQGLGMYFRNTDTNGFPRWPLMTALRAYGLNLSGKNSQSEAAVAAQVQQTLNAVANHRGTTLGAALAAATAARVVGPILDQPKVEAPAPVQTEVAPAPAVTAVDKLV